MVEVEDVEEVMENVWISYSIGTLGNKSYSAVFAVFSHSPI